MLAKRTSNLPVAAAATALIVSQAFASLERPQATARKPGAEPVPLEVGKPVERQLARGGKDVYSVRLDAGQFLHVSAEQKGIDVVVTLVDPAGAKVAEVDGPSVDVGPEPIYWVAQAGGSYRVEVRPSDEDPIPGLYEMRLLELRAATASDREAGDAQALMAKATQAADAGEALPLAERAVALFEKALGPEHPDLATNVAVLADLYRGFGQYPKAEQAFERALAVRE
jgi:hypothetical protein